MTETSKPKMKKLPFKPTALRRTAPSPTIPTSSGDGKKDEEDHSLDLFRRAKEMAPRLAQERERRLQRSEKARKQQKDQEHRRSSGEKRRLDEHDEQQEWDNARLIEAQLSQGDEGAVTDAPDESMTVKDDVFTELATPPPSKRARRSPSSSRSHPRTPTGPVQDSPSKRLTRSISHRSKSREPPPTASSAVASSIPIVLDSDSDVEAFTPTKPHEDTPDIYTAIPPPPAPQQPQEPEEEEDEFAEYIRKAEAERKATSETVDQSGSSNAVKVNILITSKIEGCKNCQIRFFLDKPLLQVRNAWLQSQQKNGVRLPVDPSELILTWRSAKVYNYSTLQSLGIKAYNDGVVADGHSRKGLSSDGMRVHMEIWTPDMFQEWEDSEERRRKIEAGEISDNEDEGYSGTQEPEESEVKIKVYLKARDYEPMRLTARPETTVETLVTVFKNAHSECVDRDVTLWFDGECMAEHVTMAEADIDDMDAIEVHIR